MGWIHGSNLYINYLSIYFYKWNHSLAFWIGYVTWVDFGLIILVNMVWYIDTYVRRIFKYRPPPLIEKVANIHPTHLSNLHHIFYDNNVPL